MKFGRLLISGGLICGVFAGAAELEPVATSVSRASVYLAMNQEDERELEDRLARAELTEASETTTAEQVLEQPDADLKSRIGVGFAFMVGTLAKMRATERFSGSVGPATGGRMNRDYLNGFVYLDSSDNLGDVILPNRTHHFGFDTPSQVTLESGAGSIDFNDVRMEGGSSLSPEQDPFSPGWELFYSRRIGEKGERWDREIEIGLNFLDFDYETRSGNAVFGLLTDRYALGGGRSNGPWRALRGRFSSCDLRFTEDWGSSDSVVFNAAWIGHGKDGNPGANLVSQTRPEFPLPVLGAVGHAFTRGCRIWLL